jgi:hypothetical protein
MRTFVFAVFALGCGAAVPSAAHPEGSAADGRFAAFAPRPRPRVTAAAPPSACRPASGRAIPDAPLAYASLQAGEHLETYVLGTRLVAIVHGMGRAPAAIWDSVTNTWTDPGPGPVTWRPGDTGPFSDTRFYPVGDHVVVLWQNASQRPGLQGALLDVARAAWLPLSLEGAPDTPYFDGHDSAARLVAFATGSLGDARRYDPAANVWASVATDGMPPIVHPVTTVALGDRVLAFGPSAAGPAVGALYDPERDAWTPISEGPPAEVGFLAATDDAVFWWSHGDERHGAIWSRTHDAWTLVGGEGAPYSHAVGERLFAFTGAHVVQAEEHMEDRGRPRDPAVVFDVAAGAFRRIPITPTFASPIALPDGRVVFFAGGQPALVLDPASGLVCTPDLSTLPTLASMGSTHFEHVGVIGDELVLWGRMDTFDMGGHCPPGAPCMPTETAMSHRDDGVAIRF